MSLGILRRVYTSTSCHLDQDNVGKSMDQTKYRGLIDLLLYLTASRLDIMIVVCICARFQSAPKESHYNVAKRILKYLQGTKEVGLWYLCQVSLNLIDYCDSDFAWCKINKKSTSGTCHLFGSSLISWHCKKKTCVVLSTAEAEYLATGSCCDNTSVMNLTKNPIMHSHT